ncbi:MAG: TolC family protein [Verrucomicrobia bacterium]|nr:TolC family protein [Verrucomicrobiota bacterium]
MKSPVPILLALPALSLSNGLASRLAAQPAAPLALSSSNGSALSLSNGLALEDCLRLAGEKHPALAAAQAGVSAAGEAVGEAEAPFYPQLDLNAGYHRWQRRAFLPAGLSIPGRNIPDIIGPLDDWNGGLVSRVTLYDFGERRAGIDAAKARRAGAEADATATQADVRHNVHAAFYALAAARDLQVVAGKNLARTEAHQNLAEARQKSGAVPQADVLRTQAEVAAARLQLITAESRVRIATGRLNTAMGRAADTPLAIAVVSTAAPPPARPELEAAADRAIAQRPEIVSSEKRTEAARATVTAARAARSPRVRADAAFGWRDTALLPDTREWQAGLSIDLPVFDAGIRARRLARSKAELAREEAAFAHRRLQVRDEVWSAAAELERAWASIAANETGVRASEESLRIVRERYERGAAVITDLLDTQTALARAEGSLAEARWSYLAARAAFERAVGTGR